MLRTIFVDRFTDSEFVTHIITIRCTNIIALWYGKWNTNGNRLSNAKRSVKLSWDGGLVGVYASVVYTDFQT